MHDGGFIVVVFLEKRFKLLWSTHLFLIFYILKAMCKFDQVKIIKVCFI